MKLLPLLFAMLISTLVFSQQLDNESKKFIDSLITSVYDNPEAPGGSILVAINGEPVYRKGFGMASLELGIKNQPQYVYRIGSISKQFAAVAILILEERGMLSVEDPITKYLPDYNTHSKTITIENLLTHTSGIPSYTEKPDFLDMMQTDLSKKEMVRSFKDDELLFTPGSNWSYSNSGYFLLGMIVEVVTGMDFNDFLRQEIFEPLEMNDTHIGTHEKVIKKSAYGYEGGADGGYRPAMHLSWTWPYAAGAILSSVDDMLKWDNALYTDKLLPKERLAKAFKSFELSDGRLANYGYGWTVSEYEGMKIITHDGGINGFVSSGIRIPEEHVYVIILTNTTTTSPGAISGLIALKAADVNYSVPNPSQIETSELKEYEGMYEVLSRGARLVSNMGEEKMYRAVQFENDTLRSQVTGSSPSNLIPVGPDKFLFEGSSSSLAIFQRSDEGAITGVKIETEPIQYGPDQIEPLTSQPFPSEKQRVELSTQSMEPFLGKYHFGGGFYLEFYLEDGKLMALPTGQPALEAIPESENKFFFKEVDATMEFVIEPNGNVEKMIYIQGQKMMATKVED